MGVMMGESFAARLQGPAGRLDLCLSSVAIRVLLLLSVSDVGASTTATNRLPSIRELIPISNQFRYDSFRYSLIIVRDDSIPIIFHFP
jgi:hypothetical protein